MTVKAKCPNCDWITTFDVHGDPDEMGTTCECRCCGYWFHRGSLTLIA